MTDTADTAVLPDRWVVDNEPSKRWPIYTRGNVGEVFPDVVTPLGWSIAGHLSEAGWRAAYQDMGIARRADFTQDMEIVSVFNGYCYLNASILRVTGVRTPGGSPEAIDLQLIGDSTAPPYEERRGDDALWCRIRMLFTVRQMLRTSGTPALGPASQELATTVVHDRPPLDADDATLIDFIQNVYPSRYTELFQNHLNLTTKSSLVAGYLAWLCLRAGDLGLMVGLTTDLGGVESAAPGEAMWKISRLVRANPVATALFEAGLAGLDERLRSAEGVDEVVAAFDQFLAEHGHRGPNEWEVVSPTWRSHPGIALAAIDRMRLAGDERGPDRQRERVTSIRQAAEAEMEDNLSWIDRRSFRMVMTAGAAFARGREMTRNQTIIAVNAAREVLYELARRAHERGGAEPADGFMLEWDDFVQYLSNPEPYLPLIAERSALRQRLDAVDPPFVIADDLLTIPELLARDDKELTIVPAGTELQGNAGSPGVARGRARVVLDPAEPGDLTEGDILVAPLTDPSWTPLFLAAAGVVVDVGATVSHAVVVSRELCIPCVVGITDATEIIPDGSLVEIDGATGVVRVLEHPDPAGQLDPAEPVGPDSTSTEAPADVVNVAAAPDLPRPDLVDLLGGKGSGLVEMVKLGLPVPPAFVITTGACRSYLGGRWPEGLESRVTQGLGDLGTALDRNFGQPAAPLLVSVRSGAPVSMPGMMDTVLNVGINPEIRDALAAETGDPEFAAQTWLRFCRMFAEIVTGTDGAAVSELVGQPSGADEMNAAADRLVASANIPLDPHHQVMAAVEAVFRSWNSPRATLFRQTEGIADDLGTAVTVQAMVFGNLDHRSGTGVMFTRDPATGAPEPYGDYLVRAQGEDVVAGTHEVEGLEAFRAHEPELHAELMAIGDRLERHYADMCDIEFTVSSGRLYILQTRVGRRSAEATVRIAAHMADDPEFPLTPAQAVARIDHDTLDAVAALATVRTDATPFATGIAASPGVGVGELCLDPDRAEQLADQGHHVVLVRAETSPSDVHGMVRAVGLVTSLGGSVSHAAVVARGWGIPAVTGARSLEILDEGVAVDGVFVAEGSQITVDGTTGQLFQGDQVADHTHDVPELEQIRTWALDLGIELGDDPSDRPGEAEAEHRDVSPFEVLRAVSLKGLGTAEAMSHALLTDPAAVEAAVSELGPRLESTPRGLRVSPEGRQWLEAQMEAERQSIATEAMTSAYHEFLPLNQEFKELVTRWQASDQEAEAVEAMTTDLGSLHDRFAPGVIRTAEIAPRLGYYTDRFELALTQLRHGDLTMLASPLKDSYHTVWFEYHEELIHLVGRTRLEEERGDHNT